jgi:uncharacterized membrane protein
MVLACALGAIGLLGAFAVRIHGAPGSVALGSLAGLAFGAAAIDSRALAAAHSWQAFLLHPLLYLLFAHALLGQLLLGMAMQRGSSTAAVAAMDAVSTVPAAVIGLAFLGDQIWPGRQWLAATGFVLTLAAVVGLSRFAQPQQTAPAYEGRHVAGRVAERPPVQVPKQPVYDHDRDDTFVLSLASAPDHTGPVDDPEPPTLGPPLYAPAEPSHHTVHQLPHPAAMRSAVPANTAYGSGG